MANKASLAAARIPDRAWTQTHARCLHEAARCRRNRSAGSMFVRLSRAYVDGVPPIEENAVDEDRRRWPEAARVWHARATATREAARAGIMRQSVRVLRMGWHDAVREWGREVGAHRGTMSRARLTDGNFGRNAHVVIRGCG